MERVQHRATCMVPNLRHLTYQERLRALALPSILPKTAGRHDLDLPDVPWWVGCHSHGPLPASRGCRHTRPPLQASQARGGKQAEEVSIRGEGCECLEWLASRSRLCPHCELVQSETRRPLGSTLVSNTRYGLNIWPKELELG